MGNAQLITRVGNNSAGLSRDAIDDLNREYRDLDFEARIRRVYQDFAPDKIMVTSSFCLLYTSPSPRDLSTSRMPSSA